MVERIPALITYVWADPVDDGPKLVKVTLVQRQTTIRIPVRTRIKEPATGTKTDERTDKAKTTKTTPSTEELQQMMIEQSKAMEALKEQLRQQQTEIEALKAKSGDTAITTPVSNTSVAARAPQTLRLPNQW